MAVWTTVLTTAGYLLRSNFERLEDYLDPFAYVVFGTLICLYIYRVINHPARRQESEN
jgi:membrane protein DedA with SNARE-associated domain